MASGYLESYFSEYYMQRYIYQHEDIDYMQEFMRYIDKSDLRLLQGTEEDHGLVKFLYKLSRTTTMDWDDELYKDYRESLGKI